MKSIYRNYFYVRYIRASLVALAMVIFATLFWVGIAAATSEQQQTAHQPGEHIVTVYDSGNKQVVLTKTDTVREVLEKSDVDIAEHDKVEPALDTEINSSDFTVNVYRAHPVLIVDGMRRVSVMTSHSSPKDIAKDADIELQDEDIVTFKKPTDILETAGGISMQIERATPIKLSLYGNKVTVYTQAKTVNELLEEKDIELADKDTVSEKMSAPIVEDMHIEIWRNGVQTATRDEPIKFSTRQIQDMNQPVGYKKIKTPGKNGKKSVTYEILVKNGKEVERKEIQTVVLEEPSEQVEIVGAKPSFSGDFAEALAKLRMCESTNNYANKNNSLYRGAYQFGYTTWGNKYGIYDPADASPAQQDQAARELYERRGWQPWPECGASLPDIYR